MAEAERDQRRRHRGKVAANEAGGGGRALGSTAPGKLTLADQTAHEPPASGPGRDPSPSSARAQGWDPDAAYRLAPGRHYQAVPGAYAVVIDVPWFVDGGTAQGDRIVSPPKMLEILRYLRDQGMLGWADDRGLRAAADTLGIPPSTRAELVLRLGAHVFGVIGIPPTSSAMVSWQRDGLAVIVRTEATAGDPRGEPAGGADAAAIPARGATADAVYRALETFTGLRVDPARRVAELAMTAGQGGVHRSMSDAELGRLFGAAAWQAWRAAHRELQAEGARSVASELTADEQARLRAWLAAHLVAPAPRGWFSEHLAATAPPAPLTRELLAIVDEVEASAHRDPILAALGRDPRLARGVDARTLRAAVHEATFEAQRAQHVGWFDRLEPGKSRMRSVADPFVAGELPARVVSHGGLVVDGDAVRFEVQIDWDRYPMDPATRDRFATRPWTIEIDWTFERGTGSAHARTSSADCRHAFQLPRGETSAVWSVHAFVRTSHFWPTYLPPIEVEVKTAAARMADLRGEVLGPGAGQMVSADHDFDLGPIDDQLSGHDDDHGRWWIGPLGSAPRSPAERVEARAQEIAQLERVAGYFQTQPARYKDALAAIERAIARRRDEDRAIRADEASGARTFDIRATFLSRDHDVPSGPLDVFGTVRHVHLPAPIDEDRVVVGLRDASRRFDSDTLQFTGFGTTFEAALEQAFVDLCKTYPDGRVSLFAEEQDPTGTRSTARSVGFELATSSTIKTIRRKVFGPAAQLGVALATAAAAMFPPAVAAVPLMIGVLYNTAASLDEIAERSRTGTLTLQRGVISFGNLALGILPAASLAQAVHTRSGVMFALALAHHAGNVAMLGLGVKEAFERMQATDVGALAQLYADLVQLEASTHASDPQLARRRAAFEDRAARFRDQLQRAFSEAVGQQALFMAPGLMLHGVRPHASGGPGGSHDLPSMAGHRGGSGDATTSHAPHRDPATTSEPHGQAAQRPPADGHPQAAPAETKPGTATGHQTQPAGAADDRDHAQTQPAATTDHGQPQDADHDHAQTKPAPATDRHERTAADDHTPTRPSTTADDRGHGQTNRKPSTAADDHAQTKPAGTTKDVRDSHRDADVHGSHDSHGTPTSHDAAAARDERAAREIIDRVAADAPDPSRRPGTPATSDALGARIEATLGDARHVGDGVFQVEGASGVVAVEVRRARGGRGEARLRRAGDGFVLEVPRGLSGPALERVVVGKLAELRHAELLRASGHSGPRVSGLGEHGTAERLSSQDLGQIAELRVLRRQHREQLARGPDGAEAAQRLAHELEAAEARLAIRDGSPAAERRRAAVEAQLAIQDDAGRRAHRRHELEGERGHPGIEPHNHFMGIVDAEPFRHRAATAGGAPDTGSWIPLLDRIAELPRLEHEANAAKGKAGEPSVFEHGWDSQGAINRRAKAGDAVAIAVEAQRQVETLMKRASLPRLPAEDRAAFLRGAEYVAEEASRTALSATPETPFDGAYVIRDAMVKTTFGGPATPGETAKAAEQRAFDDYIREAVLRLADEGIGYSEQSTGIGKLDGALHPDRIEAVIRQLVAEGRLRPGQIEVRMLPMLKTRDFGERDPGLPAIGPRRSSRARHDKEVTRAIDHTDHRMTLGPDIGGPELLTFDAEGMARLQAICIKLVAKATATGEPQVFRPHLGEGAVDTVDGRPHHTDRDRHVVGNEPSHYLRARHNLDMSLEAIERLPAGVYDPAKLIVRFGHASHATPAQAARMRALGIVAEVNLGSNVATGAISQTETVHGPRARADRFDDHALPSLVYYDTPIILSTDAQGVMNTTLRREYERARQVLEAVLAGGRAIRVRVEEATVGGRLRGRPVAGDPAIRELGIAELTPNERARFEHGYEKLFRDAENYYLRRPKPYGRAASAPRGGEHHTTIATDHGLVPRLGTATYEGSRAEIGAAVTAYQAAGYHVSPVDSSTTVIQSADRQFTTALQIWAGGGPSYNADALRRAGTVTEVRTWLRGEQRRIAALDHGWSQTGERLDLRSRRSYELHRHARRVARERLAALGEAAVLEAGDLATYGDADGARFEGLVSDRVATGMTPDQAYESILHMTADHDTPLRDQPPSNGNPTP